MWWSGWKDGGGIRELISRLFVSLNLPPLHGETGVYLKITNLWDNVGPFESECGSEGGGMVEG